MQVSQTLHMAIELYDSLNYLLILDYYDDITLFDLDTDPLVVSYYQMKTSEGLITIDSAISEDWLVKLYAQFNRPEGWLVKELGLITNTPLEVSYKAIILLFALIIALLYYNPAPILIRSNPLYQTLFL